MNDVNPFVEVYNRPEVVAAYLDLYLEKPEILLLHEIIQRPNRLDMLDLGVGAGRTTSFFASFVARYVGIDLAPRMIEQCRQRFADMQRTPPLEFHLADAVTLDGFADASFDIVLFSLNGVDCIPPERRSECLINIQRVLRPGGTLLFSSHNLQMIDFYFDCTAPIPSAAKAEAIDDERRRQVAARNEPLQSLLERDQTLFWDGVYDDDDGNCRHVFTRPRFQVRMLEQLGFHQVRALSSLTGEAATDATIDSLRDPSVHYRCERAE